MKTSTLTIVLSLLLVWGLSAHAAEIDAGASIDSVIVYPDRALVERTANLELSKGDHTIVFSNLPTNIDTNSLRTKGSGEARVRIFSIESKKVILERPREEQIAQLEAEIESVRDQLAAAETRLKNLADEAELIRSIGVYSGEQFSKEFITRQPEPGQWDSMVKFRRENLARISKQAQETEVLKRELSRRLDALLRELAEIRGRSERAGREVRVSISALTAGNFKLSLSCVIYGASWFPTYDARAELAKETVEIACIGNVRQSTGEDWKDVDLLFSTARPAIGARMPEIRPWYLMPQVPVTIEAEAFMDQAMPARKMERRAALGAAAPASAEAAVAQVVQRGTSVQFKAPKKMNVPSDNAYHRTTLFAKELPAELSYSATPKLSQFAYLTAKIKNTTGAQWLVGKVSVFVDGDFIGTSGIKPVAPNEEIDLDLGVDEGIKVEREQLVRKEDEARIFGKKKERRFKDKITVENLKSRQVDITVIDQMPVSQHDDIKVQDIKLSPKPDEREDDTEIVKWNLSLKPGDKEELIIEFTVIHPSDMLILGL